MAWKHTVSKCGKVTAATKDKYVDRDIEIIIPSGSAKVDESTITANAVISYDSVNKKIKAVSNDSSIVSCSVESKGWIEGVSPAQINVAGCSYADPADILPKASGEIKLEPSNGLLSGVNCTLSDINTSGISITGAGIVNAETDIVSSGYLSENDTFSSNKQMESNKKTQYIVGVTLNANTEFTINDRITNWTWKVDADGNVTIF